MAVERDPDEYPYYPSHFPRRVESVIDGVGVITYTNPENAIAWLDSIRVQKTQPPTVVVRLRGEDPNLSEHGGHVTQALVNAVKEQMESLPSSMREAMVKDPQILLTEEEKEEDKEKGPRVTFCFDATSENIEKILACMDPGKLRDAPAEKLTHNVLEVIMEDIRALQGPSRSAG
ncbi:MAG: hypothetical protein ACN2B6_08955 [Rickettsiales bacterium]